MRTPSFVHSTVLIIGLAESLGFFKVGESYLTGGSWATRCPEMFRRRDFQPLEKLMSSLRLEST